jgi:hypothetical protein
MLDGTSPAMSRPTAADGPLATLPLLAAALLGGLAYLLGYVLTLGLLVLDASLDGGTGGNAGAGGFESQFLELVGTLFYNAHFLALEISTGGSPSPYHLLDTIDFVLPNLAYQLVPILVLLGAGFVVASRLDSADPSPTTSARAGAAIVVAYLPLVALGTQTFAFGGEIMGTEFTVATPLVDSVLRAGLLHPLLFGALGGLGYYLYSTRTE